MEFHDDKGLESVKVYVWGILGTQDHMIAFVTITRKCGARGSHFSKFSRL
jgi:hypothetical protein